MFICSINIEKQKDLAECVCYSKSVSKIGGSANEFIRPHPGHILCDTFDDKQNILYLCNVMCGQIKNVLCYFGKLNSVTRI